MRRTIASALAVGAVLVSLAPGARAQDASTEPADQGTVVVAIKSAPPFVILEGEEPQGFSIDLWEAVAAETGLTTEYLVVDSVTDQLDAVAGGTADAAIAAISITDERESFVDFSVPTYDAGLQVMTRTTSGVGLVDAMGDLVGGPVLRFLLAVLAATVVFGTLVWLVERRSNPDFHHGILDGLWWSIVTLVTVGYGDRVPRTLGGRALSALWMLSGVVIIANFTAVVTTNLAVEELTGEVTGVTDLQSGEVAVVEGTTGAAYLRETGIRGVTAPTAEEAYALLGDGAVKAVVYDAPLLRYHVATEGGRDLHLAGPIFRPEYYGIALDEGGQLLEQVDGALLGLLADGTYDLIDQRWFGES